MRILLAVISLSFVMIPASAHAQAKPVCDTFSDAEIADLLGKPATVKRAMLGPDSDCLWSVPGFMLSVTRTTDNDPDIVKGVVESRRTNTGKDIVTAEPGIGEEAVSVQGQYGRSVAMAFRAGKSAWIMNLEKVDQKLDVASALPKLRALARKAAAAR